MELTDTQRVVLTAAADHSGHITAFPPNVKGGARAAVLKGLVARGLAIPRGDGHVLTADGYGAIGRERPADAAPPPRARKPTKNAAILALVRRPEGATIAQLVEATGWKPHSVRGALSILGRDVEIASEKVDGTRTYRAAAIA